MSTGETIHRAVGAGRWFPGNPDRLHAEVAGYVDDAAPPPVAGRIVSVIAPHAGYAYSGKVAGYAFRAIRDSAEAGHKPETVVVLGVSHGRGFPGVALLEGSALSTPLGKAPLDMDAADILVDASPVMNFNPVPHQGEHSAENEVPFVQHILPGTGMVVALAGDHEKRTVDGLVQALCALCERKSTVVVASTDMLHNADYELVSRTDRATLEKVAGMRHAEVASSWDYSNQVFCGIAPVLAAMRFAESQGCTEGTVLYYCNSGDDFPESRGSWVVGYGAVVFAALA
ncbi:AmmeMemoRadiSam system protein B [Verrucomicrobiota bacterium]